MYAFDFCVIKSILYHDKPLVTVAEMLQYFKPCFLVESLASVNGNSAVSHANGHFTVAKSITTIFLRYAYDQLTCSSNYPSVWVICSLITEGWPT